jgi:hypothetical protein
MEEEEIHEFVLYVVEGKEKFDTNVITSLMPFVSADDAYILFDYALNNDNKASLLMSIVPYINEDKLDIIVDKYIKGEIVNVKVESLYPFLSKTSIKKLFNYYKNQE